MVDKRYMEHPDAACSYCTNDNRQLLTNPHSGTKICQECSNTTHAMFQRVDQLDAMADKISAAKVAEQGGEYKDADGVCACPSCVLNALLATDPVMKAMALAEALMNGRTMEKPSDHVVH